MSSKKHILNFEDDYLNDYHAIAIHSIIEDYRLAFHLNKNLSLFLERHENNQVFFESIEKNHLRHFYSFHDTKEFIEYYLIENKHIIKSNNENIGLFSNLTNETETFFSKAYKKTDYFIILKGEDIAYKVLEVLNTLKKINLITSAYPTVLEKLKTNNYLLLNL